MRVTFFASPGARIDEQLGKAFCRGVPAHVGTVKMVPIDRFSSELDSTDFGIVAGVKAFSRPCWEALRAAGKRAAIMDKGYTRGPQGIDRATYYRLAVDEFQPHHYLQEVQPTRDRWRGLQVEIQSRRPAKSDGYILFAGGSQKYADWHDLGDATQYAAKVLAEIRQITDRPLVYRPKPSWRAAAPIPGTRHSNKERPFAKELAGAHSVVTFGSNAAFEAALAGVPAMVLGDGIARSVARTSVADVESPLVADATVLRNLCYGVATCQWSERELATGAQWPYILEAFRVADARKAL